jgi:hypothetical protein
MQSTPQHPNDPREPGDAPQPREGGFDGVALLYILGGIPAIVAFIVILFTLVRFFPSIPA